MYRQTENGGLYVESQGSFAPEQLASRADGDDVFSRQFTDDTYIVDISAAPVIPDGRIYGEEPDEYEVHVVTERREVGDDGGDTSEYEYEYITDRLVPYVEAKAIARRYIEQLDPEFAL